MVTQPCPGKHKRGGTTDVSSMLSDSGMTGALGKAASRRGGPQCEVIAEVLDVGSIQGTWLILAGASALEVKGALSGTHAPKYLQFCKCRSIPWVCTPNVAGWEEERKGGEGKKCTNKPRPWTSPPPLMFPKQNTRQQTKFTGYKGMD